MHNLLSRQLRKFGLDATQRPNLEQWRQIIERVDNTYAQIDQDRYLFERSLTISSEEMRTLYEDLRRASATELAQERNKLRESMERVQKLSLVASKARYGVTIADAEGRAEWVNDGFTRLTGYAATDVLGKKPGELLQGPGTNPKTIRDIGLHLQNQQRVSTEILNYTKDGLAFWVALEIEPVFDAQGKLTNFIATQTDITDRRAYEAELRRAKEEAESANRSKSEFLANMSHEIRTPLNAILGFAELMLRDSDGTNPEHEDYLRTINSSGKHLLALINDVLDLSKIEARQLQIERVRCSPHKVIAEVVSTLRVRAQERGIALDYHWTTGVPEAIETDPYRLMQLLINLVGNAIKFTERGSVTIIASVETIGNDGQLKLAVRDTGVGIPAGNLQDIFDPFVQADSSVTRQFGGTGLGLAISRKIAEALGGEVTVASQVGVGSTFTATVATGDLHNTNFGATPDAENSGDVLNVDSTNWSLTGVRVLLVDDGDTNRKLIRLLLERRGAHVELAENGAIAVRRASEQDFDVILMDMQMPVMDGYTATSKLRGMGVTCPIIALTAHAMQGDREKCHRAGCSDYLSKPIEADTLFAMVSEAAGRRKLTPTRPMLTGVAGES
jgi:PAS domain S-box-containing protein